MTTIVYADENWTITTDPDAATYQVKYDRPEGCDCRPVCVIPGTASYEVIVAGTDDCRVHGFEPDNLIAPDLFISRVN